MKPIYILIFLIAFSGLQEIRGQWAANGNHIYNTNTGFVGIGNSSPTTLLYVAKSMTEPTITVRNLGGTGGATYTMTDNASGANWKFKATNSGGFKIRDNANGLDVFQIEANSAANMIYINSTGAVGIGTSAPDNSAMVDMTSTSQGFLIPRMTQTQISLIQNPANGLMVFNLLDNKIYAYVAGAESWKELSFGTQLIPPPFTCGDAITVNHVAGTVAPVNKTVTYYTVTNVPGETTKCWITQNLGADHQATAVDDATEASAGWYWQFNRQQGYKHDGTTRTPNTSWITPITENSNWQSSTDPCSLLLGNSWRMPTYSEWNNTDVSGGWDNYNETFASALKLHAAGYLAHSVGTLQNRGVSAGYWSSTQDDNSYGLSLYIYDNGSIIYSYEKAGGFNTRCIR